MRTWARTIAFFGGLWLAAGLLGGGSFFMDARRAVLWAALLLGLFLLWRDGRPLLARYGFTASDAPLAILEQRLAKGELDLELYKTLRGELTAPAGISILSGNKKVKNRYRA
jgi:uncharacterized membrane protein